MYLTSRNMTSTGTAHLSSPFLTPVRLLRPTAPAQRLRPAPPRGLGASSAQPTLIALVEVATPPNSTLSSSPAATRTATLPTACSCRWSAGAGTRKPALLDAPAWPRLFDTAQAHGVFEEVGDAIAEGHVNRSELFLTSKLHPRDLGATRTLEAFPDSLRRLRTTYLDAFLLHYPRCFGTLCAKEPEGDWRAAWGALETLYARGEVRAIGVSNFGPAELQQLLDVAKVKPHLVQSWMDPLHAERPLPAARRTVPGVSAWARSTRPRSTPCCATPRSTRSRSSHDGRAGRVALVQHGAAVISSRAPHMASSLDWRVSSSSAAQMADRRARRHRRAP